MYGTLQNILPQAQHCRSFSQDSVLCQLHKELLVAFMNDKLPSDCGLITATVLTLLTYHLKIQNSRTDFLHMLILSNKLRSSPDSQDFSTRQVLTECYLENLRFHCSKVNNSDLDYCSIEPSHQVALLFHGLFNSGLEWIYFDKEESSSSRNDRSDDHGSEETISDSRKGQVMKIGQIESLVEIGQGNTKVFLYEIYPLLKKLCEGAKSYCFQSFQVSKVRWIFPTILNYYGVMILWYSLYGTLIRYTILCFSSYRLILFWHIVHCTCACIQ